MKYIAFILIYLMTLNAFALDIVRNAQMRNIKHDSSVPSGCGKGTLGDQCGNVGGSFSTSGRTAISACNPSLAPGLYYLTQNVGSDPAVVCFPVGGIDMNLNGMIVTGRFSSNGSISGAHIANGTITAQWLDTGTDIGAIRAIDSGCPASLMELDHLTITNNTTTSDSRIVYIEMGAACSSNKLKVHNITIPSTPTCSGCARTSALWQTAGGWGDFYNNDITLSAGSNACQGIGVYAAPHTLIHNNRITAQTMTGVESCRLTILDTGSDDSQVYLNDLNCTNNRCFRDREAKHALVYSNYMHGLLQANGLQGQCFHIGDPDTGTSDLSNANGNSEGYDNDCHEGTNTFFGWGRDYTHFVVHDNRAHCETTCTNAYFWNARSPLHGDTPSADISTNTTSELPGFDFGSGVTMNNVETSMILNYCNSGTVGGAGTANNTCP